MFRFIDNHNAFLKTISLLPTSLGQSKCLNISIIALTLKMSSFCSALQSSSETSSLFHRNFEQKCEVSGEKLYILLQVGDFIFYMFQQSRFAVYLVYPVMHSGLGNGEYNTVFIGDQIQE